ncbi:MAG: hypothetical protein HY070_01570 [Chloroflexi bacterium]|nr:hypothetical protein [Chloroflexota bacterium]MBI3741713.1 hypothetical protein [Chloroflexota bacterium]
MRARLRRFLIRLSLALMIAWLFASVPIPRIAPQNWFAFFQVPLVVFVLVCYIGKLLIDTFFYNQFKP